LDLRGTPVTSLPDGLKVGGDLDLTNTPITSLPDDLKVGGDLHLRDTKIKIKRDDPRINGAIYGDPESLAESLVERLLKSRKPLRKRKSLNPYKLPNGENAGGGSRADVGDVGPGNVFNSYT
jgi:hypothetical protein